MNVPSSNDPVARSRWVDAVRAIDHRYLFLDPDTGFYTHHCGESKKKVLITELAAMLCSREALVVYRHQYWPNSRLDDKPVHVYPYVWHGLRMLRAAGLAAFAYQSQAASFFFVSKDPAGVEPFSAGLQLVFSGVSTCVIKKRLVE